jgi:hypothetical protein
MLDTASIVIYIDIMRQRDMRQTSEPVNKIKGWDALESLVKQTVAEQGAIYVRWSYYPKRDLVKGYSINYAQHTREAGLSVQTIDSGDMGRCDTDIRIAIYLTEYRFCGPVCSLWAGDVIGKGGDNEDVIGNLRLLATVDTLQVALRSKLSELLVLAGRAPLK